MLKLAELRLNYQMDKKKYKINIMLIISMISIIVIASFLLLKYEDSIQNKYDADENESRELILLFHKIPDEEDLDMLFKDYKGAVDIKNILRILYLYLLVTIKSAGRLQTI